jgi:hypothetical protein
MREPNQFVGLALIYFRYFHLEAPAVAYLRLFPVRSGLFLGLIGFTYLNGSAHESRISNRAPCRSTIYSNPKTDEKEDCWSSDENMRRVLPVNQRKGPDSFSRAYSELLLASNTFTLSYVAFVGPNQSCQQDMWVAPFGFRVVTIYNELVLLSGLSTTMHRVHASPAAVSWALLLVLLVLCVLLNKADAHITGQEPQRAVGSLGADASKYPFLTQLAFGVNEHMNPLSGQIPFVNRVLKFTYSDSTGVPHQVSMAIQPASVWLKVMTSFRDVLSANAEFRKTISKSALFGMFQSSETQSAAISAMIESAGYLGIAMYGVDVYQVSVDPLVEASDEFTAFIVAMVGSECRAFDITTVENYTRIFDEFGTYYVKRADLGGRTMGIWVASREALNVAAESDFSASGGANLFNLITDAGGGGTKSAVNVNFNSTLQINVALTIGGGTISPLGKKGPAWSEWATSVPDYPAFTDIEFALVSELISRSTLGANCIAEIGKAEWNYVSRQTLAKELLPTAASVLQFIKSHSFLDCVPEPTTCPAAVARSLAENITGSATAMLAQPILDKEAFDALTASSKRMLSVLPSPPPAVQTYGGTAAVTMTGAAFCAFSAVSGLAVHAVMPGEKSTYNGEAYTAWTRTNDTTSAASCVTYSTFSDMLGPARNLSLAFVQDVSANPANATKLGAFALCAPSTLPAARATVNVYQENGTWYAYSSAPTSVACLPDMLPGFPTDYHPLPALVPNATLHYEKVLGRYVFCFFSGITFGTDANDTTNAYTLVQDANLVYTFVSDQSVTGTPAVQVTCLGKSTD